MFSSGILRVSPCSCELKVYQKIAPSWVCLFFSRVGTPLVFFFTQPNWVCLLNLLSSWHPFLFLFFSPGQEEPLGCAAGVIFRPPVREISRLASLREFRAVRFSEELREIFGKEAAALAPFVECGGLDSASWSRPRFGLVRSDRLGTHGHRGLLFLLFGCGGLIMG